MEFGVGYFPTPDGMAPGPLAAMVEERGQSALFFPEHTHVPVDHEFPFPSAERVPHRYVAMHDLFVALTAAAGATTRLRIGSAVCLLVERDPIVTAKMVASIDQLSGGRLELGVGAGGDWSREEMRNHGTDPRVRMAVLRERVEAMKAIWAEDDASYHGEYVDFDPIWMWPKPLQRPHPPILVGGSGPTVLDRVMAFGDGWFPNYIAPAGGANPGDERIFARIGELRARAKRVVDVQIIGAPADPAVLERMRLAGVRRANYWLPSGGRSTVEAGIETWEAAIAEFNGD